MSTPRGPAPKPASQRRRRATESTAEFIQRAMRENHGYTVPLRSLLTPDAMPGQAEQEPQDEPSQYGNPISAMNSLSRA
jgi:hypothetical protein